MRRTVLAGVLYSLAACVFTWPLVLHPFALFGAADAAGDPSLNLWTLTWNLRTLSAHPTWLLTGRVFDAPMFFPARHTLAYADHLLPQAILLWPVYAVTGDPVFCYNLLLLASLAASALAMHLLARTLTGEEGPAYVAGSIFGFATFHFSHLVHIQLQALYFLPLTFLFLHRVFAARRRADVAGLGVVAGLQALSSAYYAVIGAIGLACAALALAAATRRLRDGRLMLRGAAAAAIAVALALPWSLAYFRVARDTGAGRTLTEASRGSAVPASYVQAAATNVVYGRTGWLLPSPDSRLPRRDGPEQGLFPGFVALLLALTGAAAAPRHLKKIALVYGVLTIAGVILSLGPDGIRPLYVALYRSVVGMSAIRAAARFSVLALCGIAVLAAIGTCAVARLLEVRLKPDAPSNARPDATSDTRPNAMRFAQRLLLALLLGAIAVEQLNGAIAYPPRPELTSNAGRWLRDQPGTGAVACVPMGFETGNTRCMLQALEHGRPVANGYAGLRPPFFASLVDAMRGLPSPESLLTLHEIGVEWVVSDTPLDIDADLQGVFVERAAFSDQRVYQLVWSPAAETAIDDASAAAPPPEPGPPPFAVGETATYRVRWTSGPVRLPAGEATISVNPSRGAEAFRFAVSAATASWVSSFYQARVQLETTATDRILPLEHREHVVEDRRTIDRRIEYDAAQRQMRMTSGGSSITLPLSRDARDAITMLFYVRSLPLAAGTPLVLPLTDNGRRSQLELTVAGTETLTLDGRQWPTVKLLPRLTGRVERQAPLQITAWLSDDARRVPLVLEVSAAFGTARAELVKYRDR